MLEQDLRQEQMLEQDFATGADVRAGFCDRSIKSRIFRQEQMLEQDFATGADARAGFCDRSRC
jgi:hypothetical protein